MLDCDQSRAPRVQRVLKNKSFAAEDQSPTPVKIISGNERRGFSENDES